MGEFFRDLTTIFVDAQLVHQDLDPRLVLVVAAAIAVVDAQAGFDIGDELVFGDEGLTSGRDHRGTAHAAAHEHARAEFDPVLLHQFQPDVVQAHRRAVFGWQSRKS
jgi:hypothetical protein